jgi:tetratricopeptide (TPR) repeat protein
LSQGNLISWKCERRAAISSLVNFENLRGLLLNNPAVVETKARALLVTQPRDADARLLLGAALWRRGDAAGAKEHIETITRSNPDSALALFELGHVFAQLGMHEEARDAFARTVDLAPSYAEGWYALGDELGAGTTIDLGPDTAEWRSTARAAAAAFRDTPDDESGPFMRDLLAENPTNALLLKLLADIELGRGRFAACEYLLVRCLKAAPAFQLARFRYAIVLLAQEKSHQALPLAEELLRREPSNAFYRALRAAVLFEVGIFTAAIEQYQEILNESPERPGVWISLGRALRAIGREAECIAAFQRAIEVLPGYAEAYRALATIKTIRFERDEIAVLLELLQQPALLATSRAQLHFALGKALEDAGQYAESFDNYRQNNQLRQEGSRYTADIFTNLVRRTRMHFTKEFFRDRPGFGCEAADPIFVVGMPRAGSTLIQEILAAHPAVERLGELGDLTKIIASADEKRPGEKPKGFRELLDSLDAARCKSLGEAYLRRTAVRRKQDRPFFVDKFPENFIHIGLIHLILPNARIVDIRRHPLDCCLSCFKNYFPDPHPWAHSLDNLGRYYADYIEVMSHFDDVLPGRVHRVIYEQLVENPEGEVRRLLAHLGLPYQKECLRYFEKEQTILTTSVEQARQPIHGGGVRNSRNFEPWLGPLKTALGQAFYAYPDAPKLFPRLGATISIRIA